MKSFRNSLRWNSKSSTSPGRNGGRNGSENAASVTSSLDERIRRASSFMSGGGSGSASGSGGSGGGGSGRGMLGGSSAGGTAAGRRSLDESSILLHQTGGFEDDIDGIKEDELGSVGTAATAATTTVLTAATGSTLKQQPQAQHTFLEMSNHARDYPDDSADYHHPEAIGHNNRASSSRQLGMAATSDGILRRSALRRSATAGDFDPHKGAPHLRRASFQLGDPSLEEQTFGTLPLGSVAVLGPSSSDYYWATREKAASAPNAGRSPESSYPDDIPDHFTSATIGSRCRCRGFGICWLLGCCFCHPCRNACSTRSKIQWGLPPGTQNEPTPESSTDAQSRSSSSTMSSFRRSLLCLGGLLCSPFFLLLSPFLMFSRPSRTALRAASSIVHSTFWWFATVFFTFILLFGSQVQHLWCPKSFDILFDILFVVTFLFLALDVLFRCYAEPKYFPVRVPWNSGQRGLLSKRRPSIATTSAPGAQSNAGVAEPGTKLEDADPGMNDVVVEMTAIGGGNDFTATEGASSGAGGAGAGGIASSDVGGPKKRLVVTPALYVGSFMFWCDFLSTLTLLYDISFVNRTRTQMLTYEIGLNTLGLPVFGMSDINKPVPFEFRHAVLIQIIRTARVGRFIRAASVVRLSSKVNWYWLPDRLDPSYWYKLCKKAFSKGRKMKSLQSNHPASTSSHETNGESEDKGVDELEKKKGSLDSTRKKGSGSFVRYLLSLFGPRVDHEARRHLAAIKIQRAWRARAGISPVAGGISGIIHSWPRKPQRSSQIARQRRNNNNRNSGDNSFLPSVRRSLRGGRDGAMAPNLAGAAKKKINPESQVGNAMRELTAQRVAVGIIMALILTTTFTYNENDGTATASMILLHAQTQFSQYRDISIHAARRSSIPNLYEYTDAQGAMTDYDLSNQRPVGELREREKRRIIVHTVVHSIDGDVRTNTSEGRMSIRDEISHNALVELVTTIFIILIWTIGVTAFAGPVMTLVVTPINRMRQLLRMLTGDPLGYQLSRAYKNFEAGENRFIKNTRWTRDILKGMETSFLMSTIHQIGSLMKVGFGSAGVEIIKNNLRGKGTDALFLDTQGTTVSCIFLFCDIRQFTDATECLQEEVFVFTNRIAAVVHSMCHQYGGSANKNVGDAFLVSWLLDDPDDEKRRRQNTMLGPSFGQMNRRNLSSNALSSRADGAEVSNSYGLHAKNHQADKALLSVVKICIALYYDDYFIQEMSEGAKTRLLDKLNKRKGPVVQMGFGLHAGKAVQGAIGSQRKLDATYVAESVEMAEFLESSTKKFGLKMLMSDAFHSLLHPRVSRKCRKIDQIFIRDEDDEAASDEGDYVEESDIMNLYTFDIDIPALFSEPIVSSRRGGLDGSSSHTSAEHLRDPRPNLNQDISGLRRDFGNNRRNSPSSPTGNNSKSNNDDIKLRRRVSVKATAFMRKGSSHEIQLPDIETSSDVRSGAANFALNEPSPNGNAQAPLTNIDENGRVREAPDLVLPTGQTLYNQTVWLSPDMKKIRQKYSDGIFFQKFNSGLQSFYARDWDHARQCFQTILERFEDGPSRYFMEQIEENHGIPPPSFKRYGSA